MEAPRTTWDPTSACPPTINRTRSGHRLGSISIIATSTDARRRLVAHPGKPAWQNRPACAFGRVEQMRTVSAEAISSCQPLVKPSVALMVCALDARRVKPAIHLEMAPQRPACTCRYLRSVHARALATMTAIAAQRARSAYLRQLRESGLTALNHHSMQASFERTCQS